MPPTVTDGAAWSVSLSVCHDREPCRNGLTDRDALWVMDSGGPKKDVLDGGARWRHLANRTEPSRCRGDEAFCQVTLTTYYITAGYLE